MRSQMRYHDRIGFTYMPNLRTRVPGPGGGYLLRTNSTGFRSDREFGPGRRPGTSRVLLFGDSQTAGDGVANPRRYSDLIEGIVPGVEVDNHGISGSGPDQHFLAFEEFADVEHDLVMIALHVENIRRVARAVVKSVDADGEEVYHAKPYFELEGDQLVLRHVPVPKARWTSETLPAAYRSQIYSYSETNFRSRDDATHPARHEAVTRAEALAPLRRALKGVAIKLSRFQPLPEYDSADDPSWRLLRGLLTTWFGATDAPVLLVPIPHHAYLVDSSDPAGYQARFGELAAESGCHLHDPLPDLRAFSATDRRAMWSDATGHLTARGHEVLAELLAPVVAAALDTSAVVRGSTRR